MAGALPSGFSNTVWANNGNQTTPYLISNPGPAFLATDSTDLFTLISSMAQLQAINNNLSGDYALTTSLNAAGVTNWIAGTNGAGSLLGHGFTGIFDGLGNTISNLTVNIGGSNYAGLFGMRAARSAISA